MKAFFTIVFIFCFIGSNASKIAPILSPSKSDTTKLKRHKVTIYKPRVRYAYVPTTTDDCTFTNKLSAKQRLSRYPFVKAAKLVTVSYKWGWEGERQPGDTIADSVHKNNLHIENGMLNYTSLIEIKTLSSEQISKLTNIIYNTDYKKPHKRWGVIPERKCYSPRNAILFYDKNGKIYDYLEICFECQKTTSLSEKITVGTDCTQKLDLLRNFLISAGIKYGTTKID